MFATTTISVVVPAHNEEKFISGCLFAINIAEKNLTQKSGSFRVETVVVLNRCTDATEQIAKEHGAVTVVDESRCIAAVRNRGIAEATGDILVTCDADSRLHPQALCMVVDALRDSKIIGGGMPIRYDRRSAGIVVTEWFLDLCVILTGLSAGAFWERQKLFVQYPGLMKIY
ncbi:MAG TPA: glycosyltransferase [Cellvibrio sp.]|nr:glycosyltransferase [Cellvibrio sp.]